MNGRGIAIVAAWCAWAAACGAAETNAPAELTVEDFSFTGSMGCPGAKIEKLGPNRFRIAPGRVNPEEMPYVKSHPTKDRDLYSRFLATTIVRHAKGNSLRLEGVGGSASVYSYSYDDLTWHGVKPENGALQFPVFEQDRVTIGPQIGFPYETIVKKVAIWRKHPAVKVVTLGQSLQKRDIYRIVITDPDSPYPLQKRWAHLFMNQHPVESNARWRIAGMIEWLLSDDPAAADFRQRSICHFELSISPDGMANGWTRTNAEGMDMNRCYRLEGADPREQTHEAYLVQKDIEDLMASDCPLTSVWGLHTDSSPQLKITIIRGAEGDGVLGPWQDLPAAIKRMDESALIGPVNLSGPNSQKATYWNAAVNLQFHITNVLVEGGQHYESAEKNMSAGKAIIRGVAAYYKGVKP